MTYTPSDAEKSRAAAVQAAAALFFFLPGLLVRRTRWWRSPYVRYWAKSNCIWSAYLLIIVVTLGAGGVFLHTQAPCLGVWAAHAVMVVMGAFAAVFNRPLGYFHIAERHCRREMAAVYGAALSVEGGLDKP